MEQKQNFFNQISDFNMLKRCYRLAYKKSKYTKGCIEFSINKTQNILRLKEELDNGYYMPLSNYEFFVYEPKKRLVSDPKFRDKIV